MGYFVCVDLKRLSQLCMIFDFSPISNICVSIILFDFNFALANPHHPAPSLLIVHANKHDRIQRVRNYFLQPFSAIASLVAQREIINKAACASIQQKQFISSTNQTNQTKHPHSLSPVASCLQSFKIHPPTHQAAALTISIRRSTSSSLRGAYTMTKPLGTHGPRPASGCLSPHPFEITSAASSG